MNKVECKVSCGGGHFRKNPTSGKSIITCIAKMTHKNAYPLQLHTENKMPRNWYQNLTVKGIRVTDLSEKTHYLFGGLNSRGQCELNNMSKKKNIQCTIARG